MNAARSPRIARLAVALLALFAIAPSPASSPATDNLEVVASLQFMPEARLRKMHLVRPDLISFPISFDAVC